jgi:ABC-type phosphate/phosphonate transport system permease subunit
LIWFRRPPSILGGTIGKLMAEQIEAIDMKRVEAIRATGFIGEE